MHHPERDFTFGRDNEPWLPLRQEDAPDA